MEPEAYQELADRIQVRKEEREDFLAQVAEQLRDGLKAVGIKGDVNGRPKHFYSIYHKMQAGRPLEEIYDLFPARCIVTHSRNDCYRALGVVHDLYSPVTGASRTTSPPPRAISTNRCTPPYSPTKARWSRCRSALGTCTAPPRRAWPRTMCTSWAVADELARRAPAGWLRAADRRPATGRRSGRRVHGLPAYGAASRSLRLHATATTPWLAKGATPLDFAFLIHTGSRREDRGRASTGSWCRCGTNCATGTWSRSSPRRRRSRTTTGEDRAHGPGARAKIRHHLRNKRDDSVALGKEMLERWLKRQRLKLDTAQASKE